MLSCITVGNTGCPVPYSLFQGRCLKCPASYNRFHDKCYKWHSGASSWQNARAVCQRDNGDLISLNDHSFFEHIRVIAKSKSNLIWIGSNDLGYEGQWYWVNGVRVSSGVSGGWITGEPNNSGDEDCGELYPRYNGYVNDRRCNEPGSDFICETKVEMSHCFIQNRTWISPCLHSGMCNELTNGYNCTCTERYIGFHCETDLLTKHDSTCRPGGSCYTVFTIKATWEHAKTFCEARRGHLAVPDDLTEQLYLENYLRSMRLRYSENLFWIGGKKTGSYPPDWVTGFSSKFSRWPPGVANSVAGLQCLVLDGAFDFKWEANSCSRPTYFVCEEKIPFQVPSLVG